MRVPMRILSMFVVVAVACTLSQASVIQVQFNTYLGTYSGTGPAGAGIGTTWNGLGGPATNNGKIVPSPYDKTFSNLKYDNGSAATGVTLHLGGAQSGNNNVWTAGDQYATGWSVPSANVSTPDQTTLRNEYAYCANGGIGAYVTGLQPGQYDVYFIGIEANTANSYSKSAGITVVSGAPSNTFATTYASDIVGKFDGKGLTGWVAGTPTSTGNYVMKRVTVASTSDKIVVFTENTKSFMNGLQIASVPEPATMALLTLGGLGVLARRRKA